MEGIESCEKSTQRYDHALMQLDKLRGTIIPSPIDVTVARASIGNFDLSLNPIG